MPLKLKRIEYLDVLDIPEPHQSAIMRGLDDVANGKMMWLAKEMKGDHQSAEFNTAVDWVFENLPGNKYEVQLRVHW